jgi:hypothetical protein
MTDGGMVLDILAQRVGSSCQFKDITVFTLLAHP